MRPTLVPSTASLRLTCAILTLGLGLGGMATADAAGPRPRDTAAAASLQASANTEAAALLSADRFADAARSYQQLVEQNANDPESLVGLGTSLLGLRRPADAIVPLQRAVGLRPDWPLALHRLGLAILESGRPSDALSYLRRAVSLAPNDPEIEVDLARAIAPQTPLEAYGRLQRLTGEHPELASAWKALGALLLLTSDAELVSGSTAAYRTAVRLRPDDLPLRMELVEAYWALTMLDDAQAELEAVLERYPDFAGAWLDLGNTYLYRERYAQALMPLEHACELRPDWAEAHMRRGSALANALRYEEAFAAFSRALELEPTRQDIAAGLARSALALDESHVATAISALERVPSDGRTAMIHRLLGEAYLSHGDATSAAVELRAAVRDDPSSRGAWTQLAQALEQLGDPEATIALQRAASISRAEPEVRRQEIEQQMRERFDRQLLQARIYLNEGRSEQTLAILQEAARYSADDPRIEELSSRALALSPATGNAVEDIRASRPEQVEQPQRGAEPPDEGGVTAPSAASEVDAAVSDAVGALRSSTSPPGPASRHATSTAIRRSSLSSRAPAAAPVGSTSTATGASTRCCRTATAFATCRSRACLAA